MFDTVGVPDETVTPTPLPAATAKTPVLDRLIVLVEGVDVIDRPNKGLILKVSNVVSAITLDCPGTTIVPKAGPPPVPISPAGVNAMYVSPDIVVSPPDEPTYDMLNSL